MSSKPRFVGDRRLVELGSICELVMGQSPSSDTYNADGEGLPFYQGNADFGEKNPIPHVWCTEPKKVAEKGDILVSVRAPIGAINIASEQCCIGRGVAAIRLRLDFVSADFLMHQLLASRKNLELMGTGSTFKAVGKKALNGFAISIYPKGDQDKIADQLDCIIQQIKATETQVAQLDQLVKSRFVEMFGDLKLNKYNWPIEPFESFAVIDTHMANNLDAYANKPHIGIDSIESNSGRLSGYRTVAEDGIISGKYPFTAQHIIYSKIRPALNKVALPDFDGVCSADAYPILPAKERCNRIYLAQVMRSSYFLDYVLPLSGRAQMPKVNKKAL